MAVTRLARVDDAEILADLALANRKFLEPWAPERDDLYFTTDRQRALLANALGNYERGTAVPLVIVDRGEIAGRIDIQGITRGSFQSASIGYWVAEAANGRGLATAAIADVVDIAFGELALHRLQAETLLHNEASQRVLSRNSFMPFAVAPAYLKIAGRWQDHVLYQRLNPAV